MGDSYLPKVYQDKNLSKKSVSEIINKIEDDNYSVTACEWGAIALAAVVSSSMLTKNNEEFADFLHDGGCELIEKMLKLHAYEPIITAYLCLTISILAWSNKDMNDYLGEIGICEALINAISLNIGDAAISDYGSSAIFLLARNNSNNSYVLIEAGACELLSQIGCFGLNMQSELAESVAINICYSISYLSEAYSSQKLYDSGVSSLVCLLCEYHFKSKPFSEAMLKSVCSLASLNDNHREVIGKSNMCSYLLQIIELFPNNTNIIIDCCEAIMHLTLLPTNCDRFNTMKNSVCCIKLIKLMDKKLKNVKYGVDIVTEALYNLSIYGDKIYEAREIMKEYNIIEILKSAQFSSNVSLRARELIFQLLKIYDTENESDYANKPYEEHIILASEIKGNTIPLRANVMKISDEESKDYNYETELDENKKIIEI